MNAVLLPIIVPEVIEEGLLSVVPSGQLTLSVIHPEGQFGPSKTFIMPDDAPAAAEWAARKNEEGFNVYWGVNKSRLSNAKSKEADITHAHYFWADIDPQVKNQSYAAARGDLIEKVLPIIKPLASVIIDSGNGLQALFRLDKPLAFGNADQLAEYKRLNAAVGARFAGGGTYNADRILRSAGTLNYPNQAKLNKGYPPTPIMSKLLNSSGITYKLDQIRSLAGDIIPKCAASSATVTSNITPELKARFESFLAHNAKAADRYSGDRSGLNDQTGSSMDMSLYAMMSVGGFTKPEIRALLGDWEHGSVNGRDQGDRYWDRLQTKTAAPVLVFGDQRPPPASLGEPPYSGITAEQLSKKTFPPLVWVVEDILPEGCFLLSARPKVGKSWLGLQFSLAVAFGTPTLGKKTAHGKAVYLALEDNQRRLQSRLQQLRPQGYSTPNLILHTAWSKFDNGGLEKLIELIEAERPKLIVIDTLAKVRPAQTNNHVYQNDYGALAPLTEIANRFRCCIVVIHHNRKGKSEQDALEQISGSLGLAGAVDGALVIDGVRTDKQYKLSLIGRDIPNDDELAISRQSNGEWQLLGQASQVFITQERKEIADLLMLHPAGLKPKDIADTLGKKGSAVRKLLRAMTADQQVRVSKGVYTHPSPIGNSSSVGVSGNSGNKGNSSNAGNS